jgi:hypothetical protein
VPSGQSNVMKPLIFVAPQSSYQSPPSGLRR